MADTLIPIKWADSEGGPNSAIENYLEGLRAPRKIARLATCASLLR